ncbi:MAG TPA: RDD family protein [Vicinamibacterales bacterium]|jgi:uncharacterized RDD family membrane protein YckC|nr:RDD family protein [Vicinamibacterales bacterium]
MTNPYAPPEAAVLDVVDPRVAVPLADRGTRLVAVILDGIIFTAMVYLPVILAAAGASGENSSAAGLGLGVLLACVGFGVWAWLTIRYILANGQSIGKRITGIKITRTDGSRASLGRIFWLRNVVNGLLSLIPLYGLIDALFIFAETRQCLHDKIADTIVINA